MLSPPKSIRVLVIAPVRLYREGLADVLARSGLAVLSASTDSPELAARIGEFAPDVILLDIARSRGHMLVQELVQNPRHVPVVALGVGDSEAEIVACAEVGIVGYLTHDAPVAELVEVVHLASRGEMLCSPRLAAALVRRLATLAAGQVPELPQQTGLTRREREIASLLRHDLTNKEIATQLCIEVATVKNHVHNLLEKLNVRRRGEAAALLSRMHRESAAQLLTSPDRRGEEPTSASTGGRQIHPR